MELLLERGVAALETLAQDPVINFETKPPVCPHCHKMNPVVRVAESEAVGPLAEFVIQAQCQSCSKVFYGVPVQWENFTQVSDVKQFVEERMSVGGFDQRQN